MSIPTQFLKDVIDVFGDKLNVMGAVKIMSDGDDIFYNCCLGQAKPLTAVFKQGEDYVLKLQQLKTQFDEWYNQRLIYPKKKGS